MFSISTLPIALDQHEFVEEQEGTDLFFSMSFRIDQFRQNFRRSATIQLRYTKHSSL